MGIAMAVTPDDLNTYTTLLQALTTVLLVPLFRYAFQLEKRLVVLDMEIKYLKEYKADCHKCSK